MATVDYACQQGKLITIETIESVVNTIAEKFSPGKIILFGSYASGHPTPDSDLDLLIVMNSDQPRYRRPVPLHMLFNPAPCAMDLLVYTPDEIRKWNGTTNHIVTEAMLSGKVMYEHAARKARG